MQNTYLASFSRIVLIAALIHLLFVGGAWYGSSNPNVDWASRFQISLAIILIAWGVWLCGRYSRSIPEKKEKKEKKE